MFRGSVAHLYLTRCHALCAPMLTCRTLELLEIVFQLTERTRAARKSLTTLPGGEVL